MVDSNLGQSYGRKDGRDTVARSASNLCKLSAIVGLLTAFRPLGLAPYPAIVDALPLGVLYSAKVLAINSALLLLTLARQLRLCKRRAWQVAIVLASVGVVANIARGVEPLGLVTKIAFLTFLVAHRRRFGAASDPPSARQAVRFAAIYVLGVLAAVAGVAFVYRGSLDYSPSPASLVETTLFGMAGKSGPVRFDRPLLDDAFYAALAVTGVVGVLVTAYLVFRPVIEGVSTSHTSMEKARRLVKLWGSDTLSYFALREDKSLFFSSCGNAFVAYRYINGVACVSGDPIGAPDAIERVLEEFVAMARSRGWSVAILGGRLSNEHLYSKFGMKSYYLGDEAVVDVEAFSLEGRAIRKVRQSCSRMARRGFSFTLLTASEVGESLYEEMDVVRRKWRGKAPNRGFSMALNRRYSSEDEDCLVAISRSADGRLFGYLKLVPFYGEKRGYSLDEMCRLPESPNGLMEFMIARSSLALRERGVKYLSLNFAAFSKLIAGDVPLSLSEKFQRAIVRLINPYFQIESLYRFNKKFFPLWIPRGIFYDDDVNLVRVALSYLELEAFLRLTWIRRWVLPPLEFSR